MFSQVFFFADGERWWAIGDFQYTMLMVTGILAPSLRNYNVKLPEINRRIDFHYSPEKAHLSRRDKSLEGANAL